MQGHVYKYKDIFSSALFTGKEDIKDKTLLVHSEQGFGDSIQFVRFVLILKEILYLDSMLSLYVFWLTAFPFI